MNNFVRVSLCLVLSVLVSACSDQADKAIVADKLFTNAIVKTMSETQPEAEAVATKDNKIIFVGSALDAQKFVGNDTEVFDLTGKMVLPGFVDGHDHLIGTDWLNMDLMLHAATSKQDVLNMTKAFAEANPNLPVISGIGWSLEAFGDYPTATELDAAVSDRPVILMDWTSHEGWLNTAALKAGNITKDTPDTKPGTTYWMRDEDGNPTGMGMEFQWGNVYKALGLWNTETMIGPSAQAMMTLASQGGVTAVQNTGVVTLDMLTSYAAMMADFKTTMAVLSDMDRAGDLKLRTFAMPFFKAEEADPVEMAESTFQLSKTYNSDRLAIKAVKIHPEGSLFSQGAVFLEPYVGTDKYGLFGVTPERSKAMTHEANKRGLDTIIHVEGTASTRAAIDAFEAAQKDGFTEARNQLHHLSFTNPDDVPRILELGIAVNASPQFYTTFGGQHLTFLEILGEERTHNQNGMYSDLAHMGGRVSISPDYPAVTPEMIAPLYQIQVAVTLIDPSDPKSVPFPPARKPMTLEQALRAYTIDAAWLVRMEDKIGSIEVGKYADLVILDEDIRKTELTKLKDVKVLGTLMDGNFTHREGM